jgi:hypothetical protein
MKKLNRLLITLFSASFLSVSPLTDSMTVSGNPPVTFTNQIAPILRQRCEECHRPGGVAPMSLVTYEETRPWARAIREKVVTRAMPPFHATGPIGRFHDDARLTDQEIMLITRWVDNGAPKGRASRREESKPREWQTTWRNGQPDLILNVHQAYRLKRNESDQYVFFVYDHVFTQDTWIRSIVTRPGNAKVVHHANTHVVPPLFKVPESGYIEGAFEPGARGTVMVAGWVPGTNDVLLPEGTAVRIPKGMRFGIQIHYAPTDEEAIDQTSLGIYFANGRVDKSIRMLAGDRRDLVIPPGDPNYSLTTKRTFDTDGVIRFFHVHMHLRGKSYAFRFTYPDGRIETPFEVPNYDFNWQRSYILTEPMRVPKGTQVEFIGSYDNSSKNRYNPDPNATIRWGEKTTDEMMQGRLFWESADERLNLTVRKGLVVAGFEAGGRVDQ